MSFSSVSGVVELGKSSFLFDTVQLGGGKKKDSLGTKKGRVGIE